MGAEPLGRKVDAQTLPTFIASLLGLAYPKSSISQGNKLRVRLGRWLHPDLLLSSVLSLGIQARDNFFLWKSEAIESWQKLQCVSNTV